MRLALSTVGSRPVGYINAARHLDAGRRRHRGRGDAPGLRRRQGAAISLDQVADRASLGATGVQEAIYCLLMLQDDFITASANIESWTRRSGRGDRYADRIDGAGLDTVISNSFGFGGTNATLPSAATRPERWGRQGFSPASAALILGVANDHSIAWGIARRFAAHGAELAFTYQGEGFGRRVIPLAESLGAAIVEPADVQDPTSLDALFARIGAEWGRLDVLVHAIAFSDKAELDGRFLDTSRANFLHSLDISCYSLVDLTRRARAADDGGRLDPDADLSRRRSG